MPASAKRQRDQQRDRWNEGMAKFAEAARHNLTATNLAAAGTIALGAAAVVYFRDESRRNAFLDNARRVSGDMMSWWAESASAAPSVDQ